LDRFARKQDGKPAAPATVARKRATLHNLLEYAVELEHFESNPLKKVKWRVPKATDVVDRRVVVNPAQARALLEAVWRQDPAVAAFFACLYYAGPRPGEVRALTVHDCSLPGAGWGQLMLVGSQQTSGSAWTDGETTTEERALKHRSTKDTRLVPAHPELVAALRRHLDHFQTGATGQLFVARTGRAGVPISPPYANPVDLGTIYRAWHRARAAALSAREFNSMLARRPYDLRHACLSTWLNAGVPPARVAEWAGHGVDVLLRVYVNCVDGDDEIALRRIEGALR
jgi:integrase